MVDISKRLYPYIIKRTLLQLQKPSPAEAADFADSVQRTVNDLRNGRMNVCGDFTLSAGAVATTITDQLITQFNMVWTQPTNAAGRAMGDLRITAQDTGTVTFSHGLAGGDETYRYVVLG